jgi:hypothetical protein
MPSRDWTLEQTQRYQYLTEQVAPLDSYVQVVKHCSQDCSFADPTMESTIAQAAQMLGQHFPPELQQLYQETNGIFADYAALVMSLSELVRENLELRNSEEFAEIYMPFESMLFFGDAGNGDLFGYAIAKDGTLQTEIFGWNHENDSRIWVASNLKDYLVRVSAGLLLDASL